ncbi:hypothetical protein ABZW96_22295 [Nocardia sp. NPDC004168]|uniref:hypothetical protein n=1 Tax=Nocardia sp. NPDC004168 TaxID=3154452 RepID=UPI0033BD10EB
MSLAGPKTQQFRVFSSNINYARDLVKAGQSLADLKAGAFDVGDLHRAAWVQAVSALDHWLHEEIYSRVRVLADNTSSVPIALQKLPLTLAAVEDIRLGKTLLSAAVVEEVQRTWSYQALQNPKKIAEALKLVYDDGDLWGKVAKEFRLRHHGAVGWTADTIRARHEEILKRRNQIAHEADLDPTGNRRDITASEASDAIAWIERIALAIAAVIGPGAP